MTAPSARRPRPTTRLMVAGALLVALLGAGVAVAATLGVSSTKLTTSTAASSIAPTTCTLSAADADSYVDQASTGSSFGTATSFEVRSQSSSRNRRAFVQFSLAACSIPANALITAASLKLFMFTAPTASRTYEAHLVSAAWTETGVTWTNQPAVGTLTASTATGTTANVTLTWAVTADVQAFVDGTTNRGWRIKDQTESSAPTRNAVFRSAEYGTASQRPVLEVTYYP